MRSSPRYSQREYSSNHYPWRLLAGQGYDVRQVPFRNGGLEPADVAGKRRPFDVTQHDGRAPVSGQLRAHSIHHAKQLLLAVEAALRIVAHILFALHLSSRNNLQRNRMLRRELHRIGKMLPRKTW